MSDDRKRASGSGPESGPPDLGEAWEGDGAEATVATPFERFAPHTSAPPTPLVGNGPSTMPKPPSAPRRPSGATPARPAFVGSAPRPAAVGSAPRPAAEVPRLSEDTDPENDRTRADALPGMAAVLQKLGKPAPKAPLPGGFGVVPDVGADLDPPSAEDDAETRAITREELGRPPDSSRLVFDRDAGGYEATVAASFPSSSGKGGDKIAAALAEALQQGPDFSAARGAAMPSMGLPADPLLRPALNDTLQTPHYPPGVPPVGPAPVLPSSSRFPVAGRGMPGAPPPMFNGPRIPSTPPFGGLRGTSPVAPPPLSPPWRSQAGGPPMGGTPGPYPMPPSPMLSRTPSPPVTSKKQLVLVVVGAVVCITIFVVGVVLILTTSF